MSRHLRFGPPPESDFEVAPTPEEVASFRQNGFLSVERITTDKEIAWLRRIYEFVFSEENAAHALAPVDRSGSRAAGDPVRLSQAFHPELRFPELLRTTHRRNARRYAAALLSVEEAALSTWGHMIHKPPGGSAARWHQDHAYWDPEFDYVALGVWLPMHDVPVEMGAMQFIPGSHQRGLLRHRHTDVPAANLLVVDEPFDESTAVACPLRTGGATFHHYQTLHYTAPNTTERPRLAYPVEFQVDPRLRATPTPMPWTDQRRAAEKPGPLVWFRDGEMVVAPTARGA